MAAKLRRAGTLLVLALGLLAGAGCGHAGRADAAAREADRRQAVARYNLGVHHLAEGNVALALRELQLAVQKNPDDPWIHLALAEGYRRKANVQECEAHLLRALAIDPDFHNARLNLSALYVQVGRYEEARVEAERLVADPTFPAPWRAHTNLGRALLELGRGEEARRNLQAALEYRPYDWRAILVLAILEAEEGRKLEAVRLYRKLLEMKPGPLAEAEVNYRLAEVYVSLGRRDEAVLHLSRAVAQRPNGNWGKRSEEYLKLLQ
jgi:Tfp pilus assembly protein PilF